MNGKMTIMACITGFLLDCMFGDPVWMYHPIRVIGNLISVLEKGLRKLLCSRIPASEQKKKNKREVLAAIWRGRFGQQDCDGRQVWGAGLPAGRRLGPETSCADASRQRRNQALCAGIHAARRR